MEVEPLLECLALASDEIRIHALDLGRDPFDSHGNLLNDGGIVVVVIAHYRTMPAAADTAKDLLARHSRSSEAEPGCQQFLVHQDAEDPTRFALYEVYDDMDAFSAHRATAHFATNIEQTLVPLLLEREWRTYGPRL